jgi:K+-sensing histidine kinase KdpD
VSTFQKRGQRRELAAIDITKNDARPLGAAIHNTASSSWMSLAAASATPIVASLALVWLATIALVVVTNFVSLNFVPVAYALPVVVAATQWGIVPGLVSAVAGASAADFFFFPPSYSLWLENRQDAIDLALYLLVAIVISGLAARLRNTTDRQEARRQAESEGPNLASTISLRLPLVSERRHELLDALDD